MKALFITTQTNDVANHVAAWNSIAPEPATVEVFNYQGDQNCWRFEIAAKEAKPDVIFYIGACAGTGNPKPSTLRALRNLARTINIVSDACDRPWHPTLQEYVDNECFDAQVAIDGPSDAPGIAVFGPTPIAAKWFEPPCEKLIDFGFSGNCGRRDPRSKAVLPLEEASLLVVRKRDGTTSPDGLKESARWRDLVWLPGYLEHIDFIRRCRATINTSFTGSAQRNHLKGRVMEAGFARCALFEDEGSPAHTVLPKGAVIPYSLDDPLKAVRQASHAQREDSAMLLAEYVRAHWRPEQVYGAMLDAAKVPYPSTFPPR